MEGVKSDIRVQAWSMVANWVVWELSSGVWGGERRELFGMRAIRPNTGRSRGRETIGKTGLFS